MNLRGIVTPAKDQYPVIDGIARFEYKGTLITAFLQATVAERHKAGPDGLMNLKELYDLVLSVPKPQNKAHRTVFLWITSTFSKPKDGKAVKSLDNQLSELFHPHIEEYIVHNVVNSQDSLPSVPKQKEEKYPQKEASPSQSTEKKEKASKGRLSSVKKERLKAEKGPSPTQPKGHTAREKRFSSTVRPVET
jgi:hypothetical protein